MSDPLELGRVTDRHPPFEYSALSRVWFSDTDAQGVVYYGEGFRAVVREFEGIDLVE